MSAPAVFETIAAAVPTKAQRVSALADKLITSVIEWIEETDADPGDQLDHASLGAAVSYLVAACMEVTRDKNFITRVHRAVTVILADRAKKRGN